MKVKSPQDYQKMRRAPRSFGSILSDFLYPAAIVFILIALIVPALVYFCVINLGETIEDSDTATCVIEQEYRVPCGYHPGYVMGNVSESNCINCCFDNKTKECFHYLPSKFNFRKTKTLNLYTKKITNTPLGNKMHENVRIAVTSEGNTLLASLVADNKPIRKLSESNGIVSYKLYPDTLALDVVRKDRPYKFLVQTTRGPLIASDGYWEWTMQLIPRNGSIYGLGELYMLGNTTRVIYKNEDDQTSLPLLLAQDGDDFHAIFVKHLGVLEVHLLESKMVVLRALDTIGLSIQILPGPTLNYINQQLQRPSYINIQDIPRWMLGKHLCQNSVKEIVQLYEDYAHEDAVYMNLQPESDCFNELFTILFMEHEDNSELIAKLSRIVQQIKKNRKFMMPFTPHIPIGEFRFYKLAVEQNVLVKNHSKIYEGIYKERPVAFLNFHATNIGVFMKELFNEIDQKVVKMDSVDGFYLLDNWPQDDNRLILNATLENLLYYNDGIVTALNKTLPLPIMANIKHQQNYVEAQIEVLKETLKDLATNEIPILSAAYFHTIQTPMFPQHVNLTRSNLMRSTMQHLFNNLFAHPVTLSPICGTQTTLSTSADHLCAKWFINSATHPGKRFTTNWFHGRHLSGDTKRIAIKALTVAKMFSYYQYGLLKSSGYALKPMFMDFHEDNNTLALNQQYMVGDLLVVNDVSEASDIRIYLPEKYNWFEFWDGTYYDHGFKTIGVSRDARIFFAKEGSMIPIIHEAENGDEFSIMVFKNCTLENEKKQVDEIIPSTILFDNEYFGLEYSKNTLRISNILKVQGEICGQVKVNHPRLINKITVYSCKQDVVRSKLDVDLCSIHEDIINIDIS